MHRVCYSPVSHPLMQTTRGSPLLSHTLTHTHNKGLATGAQPCSAVETKHWPVLTGCDPCFRVERCQRRIDGSHPEEDVYRKILLAGILPLFHIGLQTQGRSHGCAGAKCSPSDNEGNGAVRIATHTDAHTHTHLYSCTSGGFHRHNAFCCPEP